MSGVYLLDSSNISTSFPNDNRSQLELFLQTRCKDPFIYKLFRIALNSTYLEGARLDYPLSIHSSPDLLLSICENSNKPILWVLNPTDLCLILKIQDVNTAEIRTTYFFHHYNENSDSGTTSQLDSLFTSVPQETMLANFQDLIEGRTILICPHKHSLGFEAQFHCTLVNHQ